MKWLLFLMVILVTELPAQWGQAPIAETAITANVLDNYYKQNYQVIVSGELWNDDIASGNAMFGNLMFKLDFLSEDQQTAAEDDSTLWSSYFYGGWLVDNNQFVNKTFRETGGRYDLGYSVRLHSFGKRYWQFTVGYGFMQTAQTIASGWSWNPSFHSVLGEISFRDFVRKNLLANWFTELTAQMSARWNFNDNQEDFGTTWIYNPNSHNLHHDYLQGSIGIGLFDAIFNADDYTVLSFEPQLQAMAYNIFKGPAHTWYQPSLEIQFWHKGVALLKTKIGYQIGLHNIANVKRMIYRLSLDLGAIYEKIIKNENVEIEEK